MNDKMTKFEEIKKIVLDFQKRADLLSVGRQVSVQNAAVAGCLFREQERLGDDLVQGEVLLPGERVVR